MQTQMYSLYLVLIFTSILDFNKGKWHNLYFRKHINVYTVWMEFANENKTIDVAS